MSATEIIKGVQEINKCVRRKMEKSLQRREPLSLVLKARVGLIGAGWREEGGYRGFQTLKEEEAGKQHEQRLRGRIVWLEWRKHVKESDTLRETKLRKAWNNQLQELEPHQREVIAMKDYISEFNVSKKTSY